MTNWIKSRLAKWKAPLLTFAVGQPALQLVNIVTGFLLIRWLDVTEYAMFGVAFAFQSTISQLVDLGFSGSIIALAGEHGVDPAWLGRYVRAARHLRRRTLLMMVVLAAITYPFLTNHLVWGFSNKTLLFVGIVGAVFFQGFSMYSAPLLVHRELRSLYQAQITAAAVRLALCAAFYALGLLSAWVAVWLGTLSIGLTGYIYHQKAQAHLDEPAANDPGASQEMLHYLLPMMPGIVFAVLQGQITVAIITFFGQNRNIAEISALGRISQLFFILGAINPVLLEPYIARLPPSAVPRRYGQILILAAGVAVVIASVAHLFPRPLLWLLGTKYQGLTKEVGWAVTSAGIGYVGTVIWTMHAARRWVFGWSIAANIGVVVMSQAIFARLLDLSQTLNVLYFGLATAVAILCVHLVTGCVGLSQNRRHLRDVPTR